MPTPAPRNYPETGLITTTQMTNAQAREVEFVELFGTSIAKLVEALGVTRKIPRQAGTVLKAYKASGTLGTGVVAEGDIIPLSQYTITPVTYGEISIKKWRKATSAEAIADAGYEQAVTKTTDAMLRDVQKTIRKEFFDFIKNAGTSGDATTTSGVGLQGAMAQAWGQLQILHEDDEITPVYFVNPLDIADYLSAANITVQTAFGMTYIENFLGLGKVLTNSSVPKGKVYAVAQDNIVLYYVPVNGADLNEAFSFTADATGYIGIHESANYDNMTATDVVLCGMVLFAENIKGIVISSVTAGE